MEKTSETDETWKCYFCNQENSAERDECWNCENMKLTEEMKAKWR